VSASRLIALGWGERRQNIDLTLRRQSAVRVTGQVTGASAFRAQSYVHLEFADPMARELSLFVANSVLDTQGHFTLAPVPPGNYVLTAYGALSASGRPMWTHQPVAVGTTEITDLRVPVRERVRLTGRVAFDGLRPRPTAGELEKIGITLLPPDVLRTGDVINTNGQVRANGGFDAGVAGGRYLLMTYGMPEGWTLRSAMVGGRDIADVPIDLTAGDIDSAVLTFTDRTARLHGIVTDHAGKPAARVLVMAYPADESLWTDYGPARRHQLVLTAKDGTYTMPPLAAGQYYVASAVNVPSSGWRDVDVLRSLAPKATRVSLIEGADLVQDLRVLPAPIIRRSLPAVR
jgi:hypothetical protein